MIPEPAFRARSLALVERQTTPATVPLVPEIVLLQSGELDALWQATGREDPPYWAFPWAGGQALARHILDHPEIVRGRWVVDFASGSGLVAIAAVRAGAAGVLALDRDPFCEAAVAQNAALNGVSVPFRAGDAVGANLPRCDVLLAGDVFYERGLAESALAFFRSLRAGGVRVLAGDGCRAYAPRNRFEVLGWYDVPTSEIIEDARLRRARVLEIVCQ
ncbi:MAG TPA: 50S ribosomal protein L11 methyltransferase [Anaeromyxobacter sp.]|nr:50S ribosomal protein L11 methyltransferase [Anaeromyxobacter sp.]